MPDLRELIAILKADLYKTPPPPITRPMEELLHLATIHGVRPAIASTIHNEQLNHFLKVNFGRALYISGEILRLTTLLQKSGIDVLVFKGPLLAQTLYGDVAARETGDIDLLLRPDQITTAIDLLRGSGYAPQFDFKPWQMKSFLGIDAEILLERFEDDMLVELHWRFAPNYFCFPLSVESAWRDAITVPFAGGHVRTLSPEHAALLQFGHGAKHGWATLRYLLDTAKTLLVHPNLDWDKILAEATNQRASRMVIHACALVNRVLDVPIPQAIPSPSWLEPAINEAISILNSNTGDTPNSPQLVPFHAKVTDTALARLRHAALISFTPTHIDWAAVPLPASLEFLYYLITPFRRLHKHLLKTRDSHPI